MKIKANIQTKTTIVLLTVLSRLTLATAFGQVSSKSRTNGFVQSTPNNISVFATGLNSPRGLKFGPDGNLYVAEGGIGGANSTEGCCEQVIPPVGPYTGS